MTEKWLSIVADAPGSKFVPQFLISLDSGYLYSGATSWPRPHYPSNYVEPNEVAKEEGIYAGLGIAWLLTQIRARSKVLQNRPYRSIQRFTKLLDNATLKPGVPPTWSPRFNTFGSVRPIEGILHWGHTSKWAHNNLYLCSIKKDRPDLQLTRDSHVFRAGVDTSKLEWNEQGKFLRWFRHGLHWSANGHVALQEWTKSADDDAYVMSYAVFESETGAELTLKEPLDQMGFGDLQQALESLAQPS